MAATRTLAHTSTVLGDLLTHDDDATDQLTGASLAASSYSARATPRVVADQVLAQDSNVREEMGRVRVSGSDFVTLSGGSGSLTVTLVNGLEQPVTVGLEARADSPEVRGRGARAGRAWGRVSAPPCDCRSGAGSASTT